MLTLNTNSNFLYKVLIIDNIGRYYVELKFNNRIPLIFRFELCWNTKVRH